MTSATVPGAHAIGHLHCRLSIAGDQAAAVPLRARLERLLAGDVLDAYAEALDAALGGDQAVYVVRQADLRVSVTGDLDRQPELARAWGQGMAGVVSRLLRDATDAGDDAFDAAAIAATTNVVRFDDQAAHVAAFIAALWRDQAWEQWYFGAFAHLRGLPFDDAVRLALLDNRPHLPAILARLGRQPETLRAVVQRLSPAALDVLWREGVRGGDAPPDEASRPILFAVIAWAERLGLWRDGPPSPEALAAVYFAEPRLPLDWRDAAALAQRFADVAHFGRERGWLRPWAGGAAFEAALRPLDWLDVAYLRRLLLDDAPEPATGSPRRAALLRALGEALGRVRLDAAQPDSPANALRWLGALGPEWASDEHARDLIEAFLAAWARIERGDAGRAVGWLATVGPVGWEVVEKLPGEELAPRREEGKERQEEETRKEGGITTKKPRRQGREERKEESITPRRAEDGLTQRRQEREEEEEREEARVRGFRISKQESDLTPDTSSISEKDRGAWVAPRAGRGPDETGWFESQCAGLFLLLRAMQDARLPALASFAQGVDPALVKLLPAALAHRWAGEGVDDDPGLLLFAGNVGRDGIPPLPAQGGGIPSRPTTSADTSLLPLQTALLRVLVGQRLLRGERLTLHRRPLAGGRAALVAEADDSGVWPFSQIGGTDAPPAWLDAWEAATGHRPAVVAAADSARLTEALAALGAPAHPFDLMTALAAAALLRLWARWLGRFAASGVPYLLTHFIRRGGLIHVGDHAVRIRLERRPLDVVLSAAGYLSEIERVDRLGGRRVRFGWREDA